MQETASFGGRFPKKDTLLLPYYKWISEQDKKCLKESLSACQMIKNVIRSRMKIRQKKGKVANVIRKVAQKLLKKKKVNLSKKPKVESKQNRFVIDLNVNVKRQK